MLLQVRFTMDKSTTLADLLKLNLHNFEEEVLEIVDKSVKEMGMEKVGDKDFTFYIETRNSIGFYFQNALFYVLSKDASNMNYSAKSNQI